MHTKLNPKFSGGLDGVIDRVAIVIEVQSLAGCATDGTGADDD
jgi:hypothetical protein